MPSVSINELENIGWNDGAANAYSLAGSLDIWRVKTTDAAAFNHYLTGDETDKTDRLRNSKRRDELITSRGALRFLSGKYLQKDPLSLIYSEGINKKPSWEQEGASTLHFNIAHSGEDVLIAFAHTPIGVDIEKIEAGFDYEDILTRCFNEHERGLVKGMINPREAFYVLWTKKEALLKATGAGIHNDLHLIPSINGTHNVAEYVIGSQDNWQVTGFFSGKASVAAIAYGPEIRNIRFYNVSL